jgi:GTPase SAR1 family protein
MGLCQSTPAQTPEDKERMRRERARAKALDQKIDDDHQVEERIKKLLLLGAGESGKSTLFKQMSKIYGVGFPPEARATYRTIIYSNVISAMQILIQKSGQFGDGVEIACTASRDLVKGLKGEEVIDTALAEHIEALWKDTAIQNTFANRAGFQLTDSANYYFDDIKRVGAEDYLPSEQDVLRSRIRTTGIIEQEYCIEGETFKIFDVGGQRAERKKWIHCFESVTAVLFVGVLSEYNLTLFEDEHTNRMAETLNLFDDTINSRWFQQTAIILFLNKRDLFAEKITKYPLTTTCPLFEGGDESINNYEGGCNAIQQLFLQKNRSHGEEDFFTHITCATDSTNCEVVFEAVREIVILKVLRETGML